MVELQDQQISYPSFQHYSVAGFETNSEGILCALLDTLVSLVPKPFFLENRKKIWTTGTWARDYGYSPHKPLPRRNQNSSHILCSVGPRGTEHSATIFRKMRTRYPPPPIPPPNRYPHPFCGIVLGTSTPPTSSTTKSVLFCVFSRLRTRVSEMRK